MSAEQKDDDDDAAFDDVAFITPPGGAAPAPAPIREVRMFVKLLVRPGAGELNTKRRTLSLNETWQDVFRTVVADCAAESRVGGLNTVTVQFPPPIGLSEVEVTETVADADGALLVTLTAHQPGITRVAPTVPEFNLERTPRLTVPPFTHAAQPNLTKCYAGLKTLIEKEPRLGFNDPSGAGLAWMKAVNQVLFDTSVFHGQFAARGFSVPLAFTYAKDLKLFKKTSRASDGACVHRPLGEGDRSLTSVFAHDGRAVDLIRVQGRARCVAHLFRTH